MDARDVETCTAFVGDRLLAAGPAIDVALAMRSALAADGSAALSAYDDASARPVEFDLRGSEDELLARLGAPEPRGPGRPKLGVVAREVTLLPRHWEWLSAQSGGASVVLRKLVDKARAESEAGDRARFAQETAYRFMSAALGDAKGFEEASRALFACDGERFEAFSEAWPEDLAKYVRTLAAPAFEPGAVALLKR